MDKYKRYKCDTCNKEIDLNNNPTHAFIDKCTLTSGCKGRLRYIQSKNTKDNILNFDSVLQSSKIGGLYEDFTLGSYVNASSSSSNDLVIAVKNDPTFVDSTIISLGFDEILNKDKAYVEYVFNLMVPVNALSGKDNSSAQKVLTFSDTDAISVFINGEELDPSAYTFENNVIRFNSQITYNTYSSSTLFVKVIVYAPEVSIVRTLDFKRNVQGLKPTAWSNLDSVTFNGESFALFTCVNHLALSLNTRLTIVKATVNGIDVPVDSAFLLLADAPFGPLDRITSRVVPIKVLDDSLRHIKYDGSFLVSTQAIEDVYPPIHSDKIFSLKDEQDTSGNVGTDTSLNLNIPKNNKYILGPV